MKLSQNEKSLLFSSTEIPDMFFTEYLPEANGNYIKVYFYMLFLSKYNKDIKINDLSKTLALDFPTVQDAIKYWEDKGILVKKTDGYTLADIQEIEITKLYSPKVTSSPEDAIKSAQSQYRAKAIENINSQFFQGVMSPSWYNDIDLWFTKYNFDDQVMIALFDYCFKRSALHQKYRAQRAIPETLWGHRKIACARCDFRDSHSHIPGTNAGPGLFFLTGEGRK